MDGLWLGPANVAASTPHGPMVEGCLRSILCQSSQFPTSVGQIPSPISLRWNPHRSMEFHGFGAEIHWNPPFLASHPSPNTPPKLYPKNGLCPVATQIAQAIHLQILQQQHWPGCRKCGWNIQTSQKTWRCLKKVMFQKRLQNRKLQKVCEILRSVFWKSDRNSTKLMEFGGIVKTWRKLHIFLEE